MGSNKFQHISGEKVDVENIVCHDLHATYKFMNVKRNIKIFLEIKFAERKFDIHNSESNLNSPNKTHYSEFNFIDQSEHCAADEIAELIFAATKFAKEKLAETPEIKSPISKTRNDSLRQEEYGDRDSPF